MLYDLTNTTNLFYIESNNIIFFSSVNILKFKIPVKLTFFTHSNNIFIIASFLQTKFVSKNILISTKFIKQQVKLIKSLINLITNAINFGSLKYIYFKGIGYRIHTWYNLVFLKLGYSHYFYLILPFEIKTIHIKKKKVLKLIFFQKWLMGSIIHKLTQFRIYNIFTKKGTFKNLQLLFTKEGKKKQL